MNTATSMVTVSWNIKTKSKRGLVNQGWKDSGNSVVHTDGSLADTPIALSEVQAYVYYAKRRMSELCAAGRPRSGRGVVQTGGAAQKTVQRGFWMPREGFFALALDRDKKPVKTITSNPAHGLWARIIDEDKAPRWRNV